MWRLFEFEFFFSYSTHFFDVFLLAVVVVSLRLPSFAAGFCSKCDDVVGRRGEEEKMWSWMIFFDKNANDLSHRKWVFFSIFGWFFNLVLCLHIWPEKHCVCDGGTWARSIAVRHRHSIHENRLSWLLRFTRVTAAAAKLFTLLL